MSSDRLGRRKKKKRANTLDPTSAGFRESARNALSTTPSPHTDKKLKAKKGSSRMTKSKSPNPKKPKMRITLSEDGEEGDEEDVFTNEASPKRKAKKNARNGARGRTYSDAQTMGSVKLRLNGSNSPKKKKKKKFQSQTPLRDYVYDEDDPFGTKSKQKPKKKRIKKGSATPKVSLSSSTTIETPDDYSLDDDVDTNPRNKSYKKQSIENRSKSARFSNNKSSFQNFEPTPLFESSHSLKTKSMDSNTIKLTNSMTIQKGSKALTFNRNNVKKQINGSFDEFRRALKEQQSKLQDDLDTLYDDKKQQLIDIEQKLFANAKKSKNAKPKEYDFNPDITLILNKPQIVAKIKKFGHIVGADDDEHALKNEAANILANRLQNGDDSKYDAEGPMGDDFDDLDDDDEDDDGELTQAAKQKLILGEIQQKTMSKLDTVILMEKHAKKKAKQAAELTIEVEEALKYIDKRTKEINEKLDAAKPELQKARDAVAGIDAKDLSEIKTLKSPPMVIENVMTATVMILGYKIKAWEDVKKLLSYKFKPELLNFDTYTLTKKTRQTVYKKYAGKEDFNYERVYEGSKVCGNLVLWVLQQIKYSRILDTVIPLEKELKKLKKDTKKKQKLAKQLLKLVKELQENIELYTNQCNQMIDHIIKSTDYELKQFSDKLKPLNDRFNAILSNKVLD